MLINMGKKGACNDLQDFLLHMKVQDYCQLQEVETCDMMKLIRASDYGCSKVFPVEILQCSA